MESAASKPPAPRDLSKVPSWIMLGFVLGAGATLAFLDTEADIVAETSVNIDSGRIIPETPDPPKRSDSLDIRMVEALLEQHTRSAFWEEDRTQIAVWNEGTDDFTDRYEVVRDRSEHLFFRPIEKLTRLPLVNWGPAPALILFTESHLQYARRTLPSTVEAPLVVKPLAPKINAGPNSAPTTEIVPPSLHPSTMGSDAVE